MNGSLLLARRIDHVQSALGRRTLPRAVTTVVAVGCCLASLAVAACRPADDVSEDRRRMVEWLIDRHPDTEVAVAQADRPLAQEILLRRRAEDPAGPWSARLGRFYASSMFGHMVRVTEHGPLREMTDHDPESVFATEARARLHESDDPEMLAAAAKFLRRALHYGGSFTERDVLARGYLERAVRLDPENVDTRAMLVSVASQERSHSVWQETLTVAPVDQYEALAALPEAERFDRLPDAAMAAQRSARRGSLTGDRNMNGHVKVKADNARRFAVDLLALAPRFGSHPDVGTAIYTANMTLASLAVLDGDIDTATEYLARASMAPPAESLAYGRRVAAWVVVRQLVGAGERAAVVAFLEAMADKSIVERDLMLATADDVRGGQPPTRLFEARAAYP